MFGYLSNESQKLQWHVPPLVHFLVQWWNLLSVMPLLCARDNSCPIYHLGWIPFCLPFNEWVTLKSLSYHLSVYNQSLLVEWEVPVCEFREQRASCSLLSLHPLTPTSLLKANVKSLRWPRGLSGDLNDDQKDSLAVGRQMGRWRTRGTDLIGYKDAPPEPSQRPRCLHSGHLSQHPRDTLHLGSLLSKSSSSSSLLTVSSLGDLTPMLGIYQLQAGDFQI